MQACSWDWGLGHGPFSGAAMVGLGLIFTLWGNGTATDFNAKRSHEVAPTLTAQGCWLHPPCGWKTQQEKHATSRFPQTETSQG